MKKIFNINPDILGFWTSILCAVHCSAIPILVSFGLIGSHGVEHNHLFDWIIIGTGFFIAGYSLVGDFMKHKNKKPLILASLGFILLLIGMIDHHGWMLTFSVIGGLTVATSHVINHKYAHARCPV
jgi:hypothetical protein